jgi:hypothetical protein
MKALGWKPKYSIEKDLTDTNLGAIINIITGEKTV